MIDPWLHLGNQTAAKVHNKRYDDVLKHPVAYIYNSLISSSTGGLGWKLKLLSEEFARTCKYSWQRWRASHKYVSGGTGAFSENWRSSSRYINPGHGCCETDWKPCLKQFDVCEKPSLEADYRAGLKCFKNLTTKETTQAAFHPTLRYIPSGETEQLPRLPIRGPGEYKCKDQWLPPFREPTPDVVCGTAAGCIPWQCPKRGKRCTSGRKDEWQPPFKGDHIEDDSSPPREELANQGGTSRTCMQRTPRAPADARQPSWKQGGDMQHENQQQFPPQRLVNLHQTHPQPNTSDPVIEENFGHNQSVEILMFASPADILRFVYVRLSCIP